MRNHGTDDHRAGGKGRIDAAVPVPGSDLELGASGLVFDFSDLGQMRFQDLAVLLTARQMAMEEEEERTVWAAGVAMHTWRILHAMGLGGYFKPFPTSDVQET